MRGCQAAWYPGPWCPGRIEKLVWLQFSPKLPRPGWLVVRSRFLPRWLGYWLLLEGIAWIVMSVIWYLVPDYTDALFRYFQPAFLAELAAMFWLLFVGAKQPRYIAVATT